MSNPDTTYGIADLAARGGVSRRTIRYYVRRGLLPPPTGTGRGNHYTSRHLDVLIRIRELQEDGVPLAEIQRRLHTLAGQPSVEPSVESSVESSVEPSIEPSSAPAAPADDVTARPEQWTRIALARGVELHVSAERRLGDAELTRILASVRDILADNHRREDHHEQ